METPMLREQKRKYLKSLLLPKNYNEIFYLMNKTK